MQADEAVSVPACRTRVAAIAALVDNDSFTGRRRDGGYTSGVRIEAPGGFAAARSSVDAVIEAALGSGFDTTCTPSRGGDNLVSAEPWVGDLRIGYATGRRDWSLSYTLIRRSGEFRPRGGERCCNETYAAISLALTW